MTLSFGTRFQAAVNYFGKLTCLVFALTICSCPAGLQAHAVKFANDFNHRLLPDAGCMLVNDEISSDQPTSVIATTNASEITLKATSKIEHDVFPLENIINDVANKIIMGIVGAVESLPQNRIDARFGNSVVDLNTLVADQVEATTDNVNADQPYWNYYLSCDGWNVVFNDEPDFSSQQPVIASESNIGPPEDVIEIEQPRFEHQHLIKRLKNLYLSLEFAWVEQFSPLDINRPFESAGSGYSKIVAQLSGTWHMNPPGTHGFWSSLSSRFEMASRIVYRLSYAAKFGEQYLDSSRQSAQY